MPEDTPTRSDLGRALRALRPEVEYRKTCQYCGAEFVARHKAAKWCPRPKWCADLAYQKRHGKGLYTGKTKKEASP